MDLRFNDPQQLQKHVGTRSSAGNFGGLVGGLLGGAGGAALLRGRGIPGMLAGGLAGALGGGTLGKFTMQTSTDMAHDIPDQHARTRDGITNRLNRSFGGSFR